MTPLSTLLAENALEFAQRGLLAEAAAPLAAASRFGRGLQIQEIGAGVGAALADRALLALEANRLGEAKELAGLALAVTDSDKVHYVLCMAFRLDAPRTAACHARWLDDRAAPEAATLKLRALQVLHEALAKAPASEAAPAWAEIEERLRRLLNLAPQIPEAQALLSDVQARRALAEREAGQDGVTGRDLFGAERDVWASLGEIHRRAIDVALVDDQRDLAVAHCAALVRLGVASDADDDRLQRAIAAYLPPDAVSDVALIHMAIVANLRPSLPVLAPLLERLWERGDLGALRPAADLTRPQPVTLNNEWFMAQNAIQIADLLPNGDDRTLSFAERKGVEAAACDAVLALTDHIIAHQPGMAGLQVVRLAFLLKQNRYNRLFQEIIGLSRRAMADDDFGRMYRTSFFEYLLYLNAPNKLSFYEETVNYMLEKLDVSPQDLDFLYFHCSSAGRSALARRVADRLAQTQPHWRAVAHLQDFLNVGAQQPAAVFGRPRRGKHLIYGNLVCWGDAFIEKMAWSSLPSLLSARNIPALVQDHDLVIDLITQRGDLEKIQAVEELQKLAQHCEIRIYCFPEVEGFAQWAKALPYVVFGHAQHFTLLRAQLDKADALIFSADVVYADGCFDFVARHVSKEPRALFYDGLNCSLTPMRERLAPRRVDSVLTVDARTLAEFAMQCLKPIAQSSFFHKSGASTKTSAPSFIMRKPFGFRVYSFMQGLVYASAAALEGVVGFDYLTLEGKCSELLLDKLTPEQVIVRTSTDDILWVEMDDADRTALIPHGAALVSHLDAVRNYFVGYARSVNRFTLFEMKVDCQVAGVTFGDVIDDATEARFLADLQAMKATDPVFTELCAP